MPVGRGSTGGSAFVSVKPTSKLPRLPAPVALPTKVPSNFKPSRAPIFILPASACNVSRVNPLMVCVSFTIDVPETSSFAPFLMTTEPFWASIVILPALNICVLRKFWVESGKIWLVAKALKLDLSPIKIACVASYNNEPSLSFILMSILPLGATMSPSTFTCLPAAKATLPPMPSVRIVVFSASVNMPPNLFAAKSKDTGVRVISGFTKGAATCDMFSAPSKLLKPSFKRQVCAAA